MAKKETDITKMVEPGVVVDVVITDTNIQHRWYNVHLGQVFRCVVSDVKGYMQVVEGGLPCTKLIHKDHCKLVTA